MMWGLKTFLLSRVTVTSFTSSTSSNMLTTMRTPTTQHSFVTRTMCPLQAKRYLLRYEYVPDILEKRVPHREGHLGLAQALADEGKCLAGGATGPVPMTVPTGAVFLFTDESSAQWFLEQDPYVTAGLVTSHSIEEWNVVIEEGKK